MLSRLIAIFGAFITAAAVALGGWVWSISADVVNIGNATERATELIEYHADEGGPDGHPAGVIRRVADDHARLLVLENNMGAIRANVRDNAEKLDQILARLPRPRR